MLKLQHLSVHAKQLRSPVGTTPTARPRRAIVNFIGLPCTGWTMNRDIARRELMAVLGGAAAWPLAASAQQARMPVIGNLSSNRPATVVRNMDAFRQGLGEAGYVEGRNVAIEYRWADGQNDRLPALAADLVRRRATLIAANGALAALAAKAATTTIPIVFESATDPVQIGLVRSLNRPGGNVTGIFFLARALLAKRFDLLHQIVPMAASIALLINPTNLPDNAAMRELEDAARAFGVRLILLNASNQNEIDIAFSTLTRDRADALFVS